MKKSIVLLLASILMFTIACNEGTTTQPVNNDDIISITWREENLMSPVPYITMIVYQNEIKCLHKILYNTAPLIDKRDSIILNKSVWNEIISSVNLEAFMQLDNEYLMQDTMLQDYSSFYIDIKTAKQTKTVKYEDNFAEYYVIRSLDSILRSKYKEHFSL
ncbi:MAG: hypothetical protein RO257_08920 [Candidatus Kapabacteria bacterium]|jgi:hypothetical protein|nr:hypothetical protein [Candidatus Kapabacteria bacterium]